MFLDFFLLGPRSVFPEDSWVQSVRGKELNKGVEKVVITQRYTSSNAVPLYEVLQETTIFLVSKRGKNQLTLDV